MSTLKTNKIENITTADGGISINNSGNVGINSSAPARALVVSGGDSEAVVQFTNDDSGDGADDGFQIIHNTSGQTQLINRENESLVFSTNNEEQARIDGSGRVGINETALSSFNSIADDLVISQADGSAGITVRSGTSGSGTLAFTDGANTTFRGDVRYVHNGDYMRFTTDGDERVRIASSGQIGLGGANYGTSGQVLTSNGSGSAVTWEDAASGISMAQQWRLTSDTQGNVTPLTNWESNDTYNPGSIGTSMSVSSGIFTYPSTGIYLVLFNLSGYSDNHTQNVVGYIQHTTDNSTYSTAAYGKSGIYDFNNSYPSWGHATAMYIFDVTDTANHKTRFTYGAGQGGEYVHGDTSIAATTVTFIRLGDT